MGGEVRGEGEVTGDVIGGVIGEEREGVTGSEEMESW